MGCDLSRKSINDNGVLPWALIAIIPTILTIIFLGYLSTIQFSSFQSQHGHIE